MTDHDNKLAKRKAKARRPSRWRPVGLITKSTSLPETKKLYEERDRTLDQEWSSRKTLSPEAEERFLQKAFGKWLPDETLAEPLDGFEAMMPLELAEWLVEALAKAEQHLHYPFHVTLESSDGVGTEWMVPGRGEKPTLLLEYSHDLDEPVEQSTQAENAKPPSAMLEVREYDPATGSSKEDGWAFCGRFEIVPLPIN